MFLFGIDQELQQLLTTLSDVLILKGQFHQDLPQMFLKPNADPTRQVFKNIEGDMKVAGDNAKNAVAKPAPVAVHQQQQPQAQNPPRNRRKDGRAANNNNNNQNNNNYYQNNQNHQNQQSNQNNNNNNVALINDNVLPAWRIPQRIQMNDLLKQRNGAKALDLPFYNGKQICLGFHLAGECNMGVGCRNWLPKPF